MSRGAAPPGISGRQEAARWVRTMFGRVAPRYDLLNHLLSFQNDRLWRWRTVRSLRHVLDRPGALSLDICCGSGDLTIALARRAKGRVLGSDFCHPMLVEARRKADLPFFEADALQLPIATGSVDLVTVAFGFRNLVDYGAGLAEMRRLLKPGGVAAILEFTQPPNRLFRAAYHFYSRRLLPLIGGWISGSRDAYRYLPDSVSRFPDAPRLAATMTEAGFEEVRFRYWSGGVVSLHTGSVPAPR